MSQCIFVVDDDPALLRLSSLVLRLDGFTVCPFESPLDALDQIEDQALVNPDAIVLDLNMPEMDGRDFYTRARLAGFSQPIVIVSAFGAETARKRLGAEASLRKPFIPDDLSLILRQLLPQL